MNRSFSATKASKQDEFYTHLSDIENELKHHAPHFKGKAVYCDDPRISNFFHYFSYNSKKLSLKKLVAACDKSQDRDLFSQNDAEQAIYLEYSRNKNQSSVPDPESIGIKHLKGDGDFPSAETIRLLKLFEAVDQL